MYIERAIKTGEWRRLTSVAELTSALWRSRNCTMSSLPKWQAVCSGVYPAYITTTTTNNLTTTTTTYYSELVPDSTIDETQSEGGHKPARL